MARHFSYKNFLEFTYIQQSPRVGGLVVKGKKEEKEVVVLCVSSDHKLT